MRVLVACEFSGIVRDAFRARGHSAISCDLLPSERPGPHYQGDIEIALGANGRSLGDGWQADLLIAFPPCTYLCGSGLHWSYRRPERAAQTEAAFGFVMKLANYPIRRRCIENPIGCLSTLWRKPDQIIQPNQFGHDASKATCLWLEGLPLLVPTEHIPPRVVFWKGKWRERWANQTDSGQNRLGPSPTRAADRARTYQGIADAMAQQWG